MYWIIYITLLLIFFLANLFIGSVNIPFSEIINIILGKGIAENPETYIVLQSRLPAALTAILGGGSLAVAGLLMQTVFRNPLAGPSIMGINSGASLGVAMVMLLSGGVISAGNVFVGGEIAIIMGALGGSFVIMGILLLLSSILRNDLMLLIAGILLGYLASSIIMILNYSASTDGVHSYVMWGMGTFSNVTMARLPVFASLIFIGLLISSMLVKPLDALLLGDEYAMNLGINLHRLRQLLLLSTGILAAAATAYCGPVSFIGLAVPHIARFILKTDSHRKLYPMTLMLGSIIALTCNLLCIIPSMGLIRFATPSLLPLNAVTPLFGVPVILYVLLKKR